MSEAIRWSNCIGHILCARQGQRWRKNEEEQSGSTSIATHEA